MVYIFGALALQHCGLSLVPHWPWPWEKGWLAEAQQLKELRAPAAAWHGGLPTRLHCAVPRALWPGSRPGGSSRSAPRRPLPGCEAQRLRGAQTRVPRAVASLHPVWQHGNTHAAFRQKGDPARSLRRAPVQLNEEIKSCSN